MNNGEWLQTTAKTENGYSGGPLLNSKNQVIGVNFGSGRYYSAAVTSNILKGLLSHICTTEPLDQWQERGKIRAYGYFVKSKGKIQTKRYDDAIDDLDKTIRKHPDYIIPYINRGDAKKSLAKSKNDEKIKRGIYESLFYFDNKQGSKGETENKLFTEFRLFSHPGIRGFVSFK